MARNTASKLMRWAIKLSALHYVIEHLPVNLNVRADMLTSWAVRHTRTVDATKIPCAKSLMLAPINPYTDSLLDWPNLKDIKNSQTFSVEKTPKEFKKTKDGLKNDKGVL